jgi:GNAT superfamily N-acetyltransferase
VAGTTTELERLRAHRRALFERSTTRTEPFAHGVAFFTPAHPTKWDLNLLIVEHGTGQSAEEMIAEAERLQAPAGLRHRKIEFQRGGDALVDDFKAAGWSADRVVVMVLRPAADQRGEAQAEVREVEFPAVRSLMEQWYGEAMSEAEARDLADADADTALTSGARFFLTERDGRPAACCMLLPGDGVGQVEEVYTAQPYRGEGLASAVVRTAIAAAQERGDDLIMIMANAEDWPQRLYERLGFETVDEYRSFTRKPHVTSPKASSMESAHFPARPESDV